MTKKGPLGKAEEFYVEGHYRTQSASQIAKDLDRAISSIERHVSKIKKDNPPKQSTAGEQMARREGVVTMTESASSLSDEQKKNPSPQRTRQCTVNIKNE